MDLQQQDCRKYASFECIRRRRRLPKWLQWLSIAELDISRGHHQSICLFSSENADKPGVESPKRCCGASSTFVLLLPCMIEWSQDDRTAHILHIYIYITILHYVIILQCLVLKAGNMSAMLVMLHGWGSCCASQTRGLKPEILPIWPFCWQVSQYYKIWILQSQKNAHFLSQWFFPMIFPLFFVVLKPCWVSCLVLQRRHPTARCNGPGQGGAGDRQGGHAGGQGLGRRCGRHQAGGSCSLRRGNPFWKPRKKWRT